MTNLENVRAISYMVSVGIVDTESVIMSHIHQQQQQQQQQPDLRSQTDVGPASGGASASTTLPSLASDGPSNAGGSIAAASPISASNKTINFTTSCIQFVTSLVKLVAAK